MAEFSFPFNSVQNEDGIDDRVYYAEDFAKYFMDFISDGVYPNPSNGLYVESSNSNMVVTVHQGSAYISGHCYVLRDEDMQIALSMAHMSYNRKDWIVVQLNLTERWMKVLYKEGKAAANPMPPALIRNDDIYELCLAEILVKSGTQVITQAEITDKRLDSNVCGMVKALIDHVDTTVLFKQYETYLNQQIALWNNRHQQQATDWRKQMNDQQAGFHTKMSEIEGWYSSIRTDIAKVQTFDFDNLCSYPGCVVDMVKDSAGNYTETVVIEGTGVRVADRVTVKSSSGSYTETIRAYERDGTTVMKRFVITTTKQANGSYRTKVSGTYIPPDTPSDGNIKAGPNMMLKVVD